MQLVQRLFDGPIDIVGDVHGEREALESLLGHLGYDRDEEHRGGRRLVFLGDLTDRGPDSPGVVSFVHALVERGLGQCLAGNHELNILRNERKHGNDWYHDAEPGNGVRETVAGLFSRLPLVLEREDLRLVHAAWDDEAVMRAQKADQGLVAFHEAEHAAVDAETARTGLKDAHARELAKHGHALKDRSAIPPLLESIGRYEEFEQVRNAVKLLSSGVETLADAPFYANGKWRMCKRVPWWRDYASEVPVIFGHYWRCGWASGNDLCGHEPNALFDGSGPESWLPTAGPGKAFCVDFSVGGRYAERNSQRNSGFHGRLAAMRWPERELVFDDGSRVESKS